MKTRIPFSGIFSFKKGTSVLAAVFYIVAAAGVFSVLNTFTGCSSHAESGDFVSRMQEVDSCIMLGDTKDAISLLKDASKKAYSASSRLSIYKRYMTLGETKLAEKTIKQALKKLPDNEELMAVYTYFLMYNDKSEKALAYSKKLIDTPYSSLYAECELKAARERATDEEYYFDLSLVPVYRAAWNGTRDSRWLMNAASLCMKNDAAQKAVEMAPEKIGSGEDSLFWGMVFYDNQQYAKSLEALTADYEGSTTDDSLHKEIAALASDGYFILGNEQKSEEERQKIISSGSINDSHVDRILPFVYINSARYSHMTSNVVNEYDMLYSLVDKYPYFAPGLAAYGQFAIETFNRPAESELYAQLRAKGLKTLAMEQNDSLPVVQIQEALSRIDEALKSDNAPGLVALKQQLQDILLRGEEKNVRVSRIWKFLEQNNTGADLYPEQVMNYAVCQLISLGQVDVAQDLFMRYLKARYAGKDSSYDVAEHFGDYLLWEDECLAWFLVRNASKTPVQAMKIYEHIYETYGSRNTALNSYTENSAVVNSILNLAVIESSIGKDGDALELLNDASSRLSDPKQKALVLYKMSVILAFQKDDRSARRSLQYALQLDPSLNKARILLKSLE